MHRILIFMAFVFTVSCNSQTASNCGYLNILKSFKIENCSEWSKNLEKPNNVDELIVEYKKENGDSLWHLQIIVQFNEDEERVIDEKMFISVAQDSLMQRAQLISNKDTSFIYTTTLDNKGELVFVVGKYEYMYTSMELNWGQRLYYEINRDSLKLIRGNDLPPLPELEYEKELPIFEAVD